MTLLSRSAVKKKAMMTFRSRVRVCICAVSAVMALLGMLPRVHSETAAPQADGIRIELPALPGLARYAELLAHPAYLALALESSGMAPSLSRRLTLVDSRALKLHNAFMRYTGHKGSLYSYEAGYTIDLGAGTTDLKFPVTVDIAQLAQGRVTVLATPPLAKLFPKELVERARLKGEALSDRGAQQALLGYLDNLAKGAGGAHGKDSLFEAILLDAYNRAGSSTAQAARSGRDVGDAEPVSDQWLLIATLAIWAVIVPGWLFWRRVRRVRANPESVRA
jgi:hypothetical protein